MNKKLYIVALIVALVLSLLTLTVNAASGFKVNLNPSNNTVAKDSEVTVVVNISDFEDNIEKGISSVTGKVTADDKVFESLTSDSFAGSGDWRVTFDEATGELTCKNLKTVKKSQDICSITAKVKSSTSETEGIIKIINLKATDADTELTAEEATTTLSIGATSRINNISNRTNTNITRIGNNTTPENTANNTARNNTIVNNTTNNTNIGNSSRYNTVNNANVNNSSEEKMPNTGLDDSIVKAIILVAIVGLFGYIKVKSLDRE